MSTNEREIIQYCRCSEIHGAHEHSKVALKNQRAFETWRNRDAINAAKDYAEESVKVLPPVKPLQKSFSCEYLLGEFVNANDTGR